MAGSICGIVLIECADVAVGGPTVLVPTSGGWVFGGPAIVLQDTTRRCMWCGGGTASNMRFNASSIVSCGQHSLLLVIPGMKVHAWRYHRSIL
ncbi:hypothetical protein HanHA89_Chr11g0412331 [Helianthus annuus]|nr:hypothetical protein HanHA89_Chr11g0412331 [Helianthus annuus]